MWTISLKSTVLAVVAGFMVATVSAVPQLTPIFPTSSRDVDIPIESMPSIITGTGTYTLPSDLSEPPGPVVTGGTGTGSIPPTGSVSVTVFSSSTNSSTSSGTGTTAAPASITSSTSAGLPAQTSNILIAGFLMLSAAGVHLL